MVLETKLRQSKRMASALRTDDTEFYENAGSEEGGIADDGLDDCQDCAKI